MAAKKTQCPFCESIFAVTPEQLSARGGHVRCGKCFQVFKADEHLVLPTPLGSSAPAPAASAAVDIFDLLDQPNSHDDESDTLAGQPALPAAQPRHVRQITPEPQAKASDLGKLEQKADLESDFDALFTSLAPQSIDLNESYAQSAQSKQDELDLTSLDLDNRAATPEPNNRLLTPIPEVTPQPSRLSTPAADSLDLDLPSFDPTKATAQIQDTPLPGSVPAVVLPSLGKPVNPTKTSTSVFNKKQVTSAKLSSLKLDDELSELFLGDSSFSAKKDLLKHHDTASVDKLSSTADESWADALLQEEEEAKKIAAEQQAAALLGSKKPPSVLKPSSATLSAKTDAKAANPPTRKPSAPDQSTHRQVALEEDDLLSYLSQVGAASEKADDLGGARHSGKAAAQPQALPPPASHRVRVPVKPKQSPAHYVAWGALCGVLLLLLAAQWLYFNFTHLATDPRYNSRLTAICASVGCQVPSMDLTQIATGRVKLQRSPNDRNTTQVTLILTNQANNSQLMPKLKFLQLNNGQVEAYRLVEPHEYLQGNDRQLKQLLPRQSLQVEFHLNIERPAIKTYAIDPVY